MNRTSIEWIVNPDGSRPGWSWNPITGCLNNCSYCYARKLANGRLKPLYLANRNWARQALAYYKHHEGLPEWTPFYPRFWEERLKDIQRGYHYTDWSGACAFGAAAKGIFVCDMSDLFGVGIPEEWTRRILEAIAQDRIDRFYLLTKQPQNLIKFSPFPENCWVGVTARSGKMVDDAGYYLERIEAKVKFLSLEPLLEPMLLYFGKPTIGWLIIGACTGTEKEMANLARNNNPFLTEMPYGKLWTAQPSIEWVREIVQAADKAGIPVFLKDNLMPLFKKGDIWAIPEWAGFNDWSKQAIGTTLRQELPETCKG